MNTDAQRARGRRHPHVWIPAIIVVAITAVLLVSASSVLIPAHDVRVRPVIFDRQPEVRGAIVTSVATTPGVTVQAPGWLEADPYVVACTALADGVVRTIHVLEGESVEAGDVVAELIDEDARIALDRAEADLAVAVAARDIAVAARDAARTEWEEPVERTRAVDAARARVGETAAELAQLPSLIEEASAIEGRIREELRQMTQAFEDGAAADIEVVIIRKRLEAQAAAVRATAARDGVLRARLERERADLHAAERHAELRTAERQALATAEAALARAEAEVARASAESDEARLRLDRMTIRAPISGNVQSRLKAPGDKVRLAMDDPHSAHMLHLYDPASLQVRVDVPLADASHIMVGQQCEVVVDILPDTTFRGEVTRITHEADLQKNTLQVKVRVIDPAPVLRPEMLTRVRFLPGGADPSSRAVATGAPSRARVAESCIDEDDRVWVVRRRTGRLGRVYPVGVIVITSADGWATVEAPLQPGDLLVDAPDVGPGERVRITAPGGASGGES